MSASVAETMRMVRTWAEREAAADERRRRDRLACLARITAASARERQRLNAS